MRVLIAGCGYVGIELAGRLVSRGADVFAMRRRPGGQPAGVSAVAADVGDPSTLRSLPEALDAIVYLVSADARDEGAYRAAYVDGVAHLLAATRAGRFLFASSTSVYAQRGGEWVDEASPTRPSAMNGRLVLEGESTVRARHPEACCVRFGGIYGPGRRRLLDAVAAGDKAWRPGHYTNRIHRDDCAGVLAHLLGLRELPPVRVAVDREPALEETLVRWLAARLGAPEPGPARGEGAAGPGSKRCSSAALVASGYEFRYPTFREGYGAMLSGGAPPASLRGARDR